jgi:hypothetical protein
VLNAIAERTKVLGHILEADQESIEENLISLIKQQQLIF